jgi:sugar O-acyltransferase (sialic acid O-acetyltransferase NeuD family)
VIIGTGHHGRLASGHIIADSAFDVVAFSAERDYITEKKLYGLPVVPFENLEEHFDPSKYKALVALSGSSLNRTRTRLYEQAKAKGFNFVSYICSQASVFKNVEIGENCVVHDGAVVEIDVKIGNNVHVAGGAMVSHHCKVADNCFIGVRAVIAGECEIGENSFLGANCTLIDSVKVARDCVVGAGAVLLHDTEPGRIYVGNPAKPMEKSSYEHFGLEATTAEYRVIDAHVEL